MRPTIKDFGGKMDLIEKSIVVFVCGLRAAPWVATAVAIIALLVICGNTSRWESDLCGSWWGWILC